MTGAICFGAAFGLPFMALGLILIVDRERSWQRKLRNARAGEIPRRSPGWDRRQIGLGLLLILFGAAVFALLLGFNLWAQGISPAAPM